jgi:Ni/Fe-hydrogenase subunit HybB-like protein
MTVAAGALWRVDTYLTAFNGGPGWDYWPSLGEVAVTVGMAALGMAVFVLVSRVLPVVVVEDVRQTSVGAGRVRAVASR